MQRLAKPSSDNGHAGSIPAPSAEDVYVVPTFTRVRNGKEHVVPAHERKRPKPRWTDEAILEAMRKWVEMYGDVPAIADWNPALARQQGTPRRQARYLNGVWPGAATVVRHFGSWTAAITAAGLEPNISGPKTDVRSDPAKLSRRNLMRLRSVGNQKARVGPAEFTAAVRDVAKAERTGEPVLLQDALFDLAAIAVAWADRADR